LQWEETRKLNLGIDLGFFKDRIGFSANYFRNRSSNQLLRPQLPWITGFQDVTQNLPAVIQNSGWELTLSVSPVKTAYFTWQASINFTNPKNKLVSYPGLANSINANVYFIGEPINVIQLFRFAGVNPQTGVYEYYNANGEKTNAPDYATDRTAHYDPNPKYYGGISNTISYKGWQLDFFFQAVKQTAKNSRLGYLPGFANQNQPVSVLDRWRNVGQFAPIQKYTQTFDEAFDGFANAGDSDADYADASYIRLKNIALSYTLGDRWLQKAKIATARVYIQGQNMLTLTKFKGTDPETLTAGVLPPLRIFTIGTQFTF
jgi:hypothetical protein